MANVAVPSIATATPTDVDTVLGVQSGAVRRFSVANLRAAATTIAPIGISVDSQGAVGDGITDDTLALRAAITAAGVGGTILFTPGKTYLVSGSLTPLEGQTFWGYGATIKRRAEITSATATVIGIGAPPTITVADGSLFSVGMDVTVINGATFDTASHRILSVVGNVLTVGTNFDTAFPAGGTVITAFASIYSGSVAGVSIMGLTFDGNRANNATLAKWQLHSAVVLYSDRGVVQDCYVHDEVSEGLILGGNGVSARNNTITDCGGNGIHFSGCVGAEASGNYIKDVNLLGSAPGHADGCIIFSNATGDSIIANNYCENGLSGIGSIDSNDNSGVVISGNTIRNCTVTAIEGTFPASTTGGKVTITGNLIYDSVCIYLSFSGSFAIGSGPYSWVVSNNFLSNTRISVGKAAGIVITGNIITSAADTTNTLVYIADSQQVTCSGNQVTGGVTGIYFAGSNSAAVKISGNTLLNNYSRGISVDSDVSARGNSVESNTLIIESAYTTSGDYYGINASNNLTVTNNVLDIQTTSTGAGIGCPNGGVSTNGAIVNGNVIRSAGLSCAIRTYGGSQNNWIVNNYTQQTVSNGGGASNTVAGNYTIF